jgi:hypothetical protein
MEDQGLKDKSEVTVVKPAGFQTTGLQQGAKQELG